MKWELSTLNMTEAIQRHKTLENFLFLLEDLNLKQDFHFLIYKKSEYGNGYICFSLVINLSKYK